MHLERYITVRHLEAMAKVTLLTGSIVGFSYATEIFAAWFNGSLYERRCSTTARPVRTRWRSGRW